MVTANFAAIAGFSLIAVALVAVFFFSLPSLAWFYACRDVLLGLLEVVRFGVQVTFEMPVI